MNLLMFISNMEGMVTLAIQGLGLLGPMDCLDRRY